jgi:Protein of unknown function (DUF3822)
LKIAFKIPPIIEDVSASHLLVELSNCEVSFLIFSKTPLASQGFYVYELDKNIPAIDYARELKMIIEGEGIFHQSFATVQVCYNFSTFTLVPKEFFVEAEKENMLYLMFGKDASSYCFYEDVLDNDMKIVYRVSSKIYETVNELFPKNKFSHASSMQLQANKLVGDALKCIVYHNSIKLILCKDSQLQIVQFFDYETPIDVSYHLLNVCERFAISASNVKLILSGMIDKKSNLYDDIHKYFLHIQLSTLPVDTIVSEDMYAHPTHFYHNLTSLAECVS